MNVTKMTKSGIVLLVSVLSVILGVSSEEASPGFAPYQVSLRNSGDAHFCGGAILSKRTILTAAQCVADRIPSTIFAVVGTNKLITNTTRYSMNKIVVSPAFSLEDLYSDLAILHTSTELESSFVSTPIPVRQTNILAGEPCILTGWGMTKSPSSYLPNDMQTINVRSISVTECRGVYKFVNDIYDDHLCTIGTYGNGYFRGDTGGPLMTSGELVGIVSFGSDVSGGIPIVYSRTWSHRNWIASNTIG